MTQTCRIFGFDTCGCRLWWGFDDEADPITVVHSYMTEGAAHALAANIRRANGWSRKVQPPEFVCPAHEALGSTSEMFAVVMEENSRKNIALGSVLAAMFPELRSTDFGWEYDDQRVLVINIRNVITAAQRASVQAACDIRFSPGLVRVVEWALTT